jgi:DNA-binding NarL/FixJ family response regulator
VVIQHPSNRFRGTRWGWQASRGSVVPPSGTGCRIETVLTGADNLEVSPTVLIVDDHAAFRAGARAVLEADGYDVVGEAPDGQRGLDAVQTLNPDVVLLDVRLPDMDGFTVAGRLAACGCGSAVIVTSSSDDPLYRERAHSSGARGFVAKHDVCGAALDRLLS